MGFDGVDALDARDGSIDSSIDGPPPFALIGELDPTFGAGGVAVLDGNAMSTGFALLPRANGGVLVVGVVEASPGVHVGELTAWTAAGVLDPTYGNAGRIRVSLASSTWAYGARRLSDGRAVIWGDGIEDFTQGDDFMFALLGPDEVPLGGAINIDIQDADTANGVVERPGGGFVMCGVANREANDTHYALAFTSESGVLDDTIGNNGIRYDDEAPGEFNRCWDMVTDAQGRIVTAGTGSNDLILTRHLPDGTRDPSFAGNGRAVLVGNEGEGYSVAFAPDGAIVLVGISGPFGIIARFDEAGLIDPTFAPVSYLNNDGPGASDTFYDALLQSDGKIIVAGIHSSNGTTDAQLLRFDPTGALDPTFGTAGVIRIDRSAGDEILALAPAAGGGVFATGSTNDTTWLIKVR